MTEIRECKVCLAPVNDTRWDQFCSEACLTFAFHKAFDGEDARRADARATLIQRVISLEDALDKTRALLRDVSDRVLGLENAVETLGVETGLSDAFVPPG